MSKALLSEHPGTPAASMDIDYYLEKWRGVEGNLIMILHQIQDTHGYIPRELVMQLDRALGIRLARIYEVITFYHYFKLVPPGKHHISICNGTACYLKGAANIIGEIEKTLGVKEGETTGDRLFQLETVRCIGCCGMSPAMMVDGRVCGHVKTTDLPEMINTIRKNEEQA
ncbi:MAG: NAD(P)H-dependent oxidoreductase subunit E [Verrucomicrobiota bacterium]|nr:NAD(P)H-dependent oxidoreductase subunit E [Verrucomicrobiota bacterium]